jgi:Domain of unknown function (DUF397)
MTARPQDVLLWRKARASVQGNCVEVAARGQTIYVRDSKCPDGPTLAFTTAEWMAFLTGVQAGEFSLSALAG